MRRLEVLITSGGTISRIDDVRHIGNFSKGTTGALIAEQFLKSGALVHYVHNKQAVRPFVSRLKIDPENGLEQEIGRVSQVYSEFMQVRDNLSEYQFETFDEYYKTVEGLLTGKPIDVVVLAAAVSDYSAAYQGGKISSDLETLSVELKRNPKVISLVKKWSPRVFQVGFKLMADTGLDRLIDVAYRQGIANHSDLTVANSVFGGDFGKRATVLITPEKGIVPVEMAGLPAKLVEIVGQRVSKRHYRTELDAGPGRLDGLREEQSSVRDDVDHFWRLNLFEPYFEGADKHFGFVARRVPRGGFLITSRGSDKERVSCDSIVYVPKVNFDSRTVYVESEGNKASLNANVAAKIFKSRPEVDLILHSHVFLGISDATGIDYAPGAQEDLDEVMSKLGRGKSIIGLKDHGVIVLGKDRADIVKCLEVEPAYRMFPHLYDVIYARFYGSSDFFDLIRERVPIGSRVLDLAAGTGAVSLELLRSGYMRVSLADGSQGMLDVAKTKIGDKCDYHHSAMEGIQLDKKFDAIVVRQAINYLMEPNRLVKGLRRIKDHLVEGGLLIFNAPGFKESDRYRDKLHSYDFGGYHVKVREMNLRDGRTLIHTQNCVLKSHDGREVRKVYDINRFGLFTTGEFEVALSEAGFREIEFFGKGLGPYDSDSKSLYCVALR